MRGNPARCFSQPRPNLISNSIGPSIQINVIFRRPRRIVRLPCAHGGHDHRSRSPFSAYCVFWCDDCVLGSCDDRKLRENIWWKWEFYILEWLCFLWWEAPNAERIRPRIIGSDESHNGAIREVSDEWKFLWLGQCFRFPADVILYALPRIEFSVHERFEILPKYFHYPIFHVLNIEYIA